MESQQAGIPFEQELEELLYSQAEDKILLPVEILRNMPYPCAYFETPNLLGEQFHGFLFVLIWKIKWN